MELLRKFWRNIESWTGLPGRRLIEYMLLTAYSVVALLSLIIGLYAKAGTLFGPALESNTFVSRPELKSIMKHLLVASADFMVGASLLIIAGGIVFWSQRKAPQPEALDRVLPTGPPFLL